MNGEIAVDSFVLSSVVPVMIARHDEVIFQPFCTRTEVQVRKRGMEGHKQNVANDGALLKSAQRQWDHDQTARDDDVEEVRA